MSSSKPEQRQLKHVHTCDKCGEKYSHMHPAKDSNHQQFEFQCPNPECAWHPSHGSPKNRPQTWDADGNEFSWPREVNVEHDKRPGGRTFRNNKHKTVVLTFERGDIKCDNPDHYKMVKREGSKWLHPEPRPAVEILRDMEPFKKAACPCERAACRAAWSMDRPGPLQTEWVVNGTYVKGVGEVVNGQPKTVMPLGYRLSKKQFEELHSRFPDYHFVQVRNDGHDHPVSHAITQVATFEMMRGFKNKGKKIFDIHGNPAANALLRAELGLDLTTGVRLETARDYVRAATKWGNHDYVEMTDVREASKPSIGEDGKPWGMKDTLEKVDAYTSVHTTYYYPVRDIINILSVSKPRATWTAIMHRFEGDEGTINNGELKWTRKRDGHIQQVNVSTGEKYSHPDNNMWFDQDAYSEVSLEAAADRPSAWDLQELKSLAWTKTEVTPGTYRITATLCSGMAANLTLCGDIVVKKYVQNTVDIKVGSHQRKVAIKSNHSALFDACKSAISNKPRTERQWTAHVATCKVKARAHFSDTKVEVSSDELDAVTLASFWSGFEQQATDQITFNSCAQFLVNQHSLSMQGKSLTKANNFVDLALSIIERASEAKPGRETVKAVSSSIRAVMSHT